MFGPDSFPLEWPEALRVLRRSIGAQEVVVPGHGDAVTAVAVDEQRERLAEVAAEIRLRLARGADHTGELPARLLASWSAEQLRVAIRAAVAASPRPERG